MPAGMLGSFDQSWPLPDIEGHCRGSDPYSYLVMEF